MLNIAFIGYSQMVTRYALDKFVEDNREQVYSYDRLKGFVLLRDATVIRSFEAYIPDRLSRDLRFDQVIVADDSRKLIYQARRDDLEIMRLWLCRSQIPKEFQWQFYDLDAEEKKDD